MIKAGTYTGRQGVTFFRQHGLTLTELMVTLTISLIILAGASIVLVNANKSSRLQDGLVGLQENARFAIQQISDDIQLAGYYGCVEDIDPSDSAGPIISKLTTNVFLTAPVVGYDNTDATAMALTGASRDVLELQFARPISALTADMESTLSPLTIADPAEFSVGDIAMVASCEAGDIFAISDITGNVIQHQTDTTSGETLTNANTTDSLSSWYPAQGYVSSPTRLFTFTRVKYYIGDDGGVPTLFRTVNRDADTTGVTDEAFIRGVDAFELLYGEDTDNDSRPDTFVKAGAVTSWGNVAAIRFALLLRTEAEYGSDFDKAADEGETIELLGEDFTADDSRVRRRVYESTVYIRNTI